MLFFVEHLASRSRTKSVRFLKFDSLSLRPLFLVLLLFSLLPALASCGARRYYWKQKLTVVVETPDGDKSGSSVSSVYLNVGGWRPLSQSAMNVQFKGEAIAVELAPGKYVFVLLEGMRGIATLVYGETFFKKEDVNLKRVQRSPSKEPLWAFLESPQPAKRVRPKFYPRMVTFQDINKPASVRLVDPYNLSASFGPGYRIKSMTIEITDEPVTRGEIEKVLGWLEKYRENGFRMNGKKCVACPVSGPLKDMIGTGAFKIGDI